MEERYNEIEKLLSYLDNEKKDRVDEIVSTTDLEMVDGKLVYNEYEYNLTKLAQKQLARKLGITYSYWQKMVDEKQFELLDTNVNKWLVLQEGKSEYHLISHNNYDIEAFLSPRYKIVDNYDVLNTIINNVDMNKFDFRIGWQNNENNMIGIQLLEPDLVRKVSIDDSYIAGKMFQFSDLGGGINSGSVVWREVCSNGMMGFAESNENKIRMNGHMKNNREYRKDPIYIEEEQAVKQMIEILSKRSINIEEIDKRIKNLLDRKEQKIEDIEALVWTLKSYLAMSDDEFLGFVTIIKENKVDNFYDLIQEITNFAKNLNVSKQMKLEQMGGILTDNKGNILDHLIINSEKMRKRLDKREDKWKMK